MTSNVMVLMSRRAGARAVVGGGWCMAVWVLNIMLTTASMVDPHAPHVTAITLATMRLTWGNGWSCRGRDEHVEHSHGHAPPTTHHRTGPARRLMSIMTFDVITQQPLGVVCADFSMCQWEHAAARHMHPR